MADCLSGLLQEIAFLLVRGGDSWHAASACYLSDNESKTGKPPSLQETPTQDMSNMDIDPLTAAPSSQVVSIAKHSAALQSYRPVLELSLSSCVPTYNMLPCTCYDESLTSSWVC